MQEDLRLAIAWDDARRVGYFVLVQMRAHGGKSSAGKGDVIHQAGMADLAFR